MSIRRITVAFVDPDGRAQTEATGSVDRRAELIRQARSDLERFKSAARVAGDPRGEMPFEMLITDAPASGEWTPAGR